MLRFMGILSGLLVIAVALSGKGSPSDLFALLILAAIYMVGAEIVAAIRSNAKGDR